MYEFTVSTPSGRSNLVTAIEISLIMGDVRISKGSYKITIERTKESD